VTEPPTDAELSEAEAESDKLRTPLTNLEMAELNAACRLAGLTNDGMMLLRRLMYEVSEHREKAATRRVKACR